MVGSPTTALLSAKLSTAAANSGEPPPSLVILEHPFHVRETSLDEEAGKGHTLLMIHIVCGLGQREVAGGVLFPGHVGARPVAIVVVDVSGI